MKKKPTTLSSFEQLGEVLTPSYAKGGVVTKAFEGVKENAELRAKLRPKVVSNIAQEYLAHLEKKSPEQLETQPTAETKRVSLLAKQKGRY